MQGIDYLGLPSIVSVLIYPIIAIYCGVEFGFKVKTIIINLVLCVVIVGGIQTLASLPICYFLNLHIVEEVKLLTMVAIMFIIVTFGLPVIKPHKLSLYLQNKEVFLLLTLMICMGTILFWLIGYKKIDWMEFDSALILYICITFILTLSVQLIKYKLKVKEAEIELKMYQVYSEPFQALIDNIRLKQHEFDNHINTIYSLHFSYHTYEELVEAQKQYCENIVGDNRFNKLLAKDNSVIRGFLYARFIEIDKKGIEISYQVSIGELEVGVPLYKIVEILGDLINNAVEALEVSGEKKRMHVSILEADNFMIEVRNECMYLSYSSIEKFFNKGYSKKGEGRGLGLYNVKQICEEYGLKIISECKEIDKENWLSFRVQKGEIQL